jgi:hypothetical protein
MTIVTISPAAPPPTEILLRFDSGLASSAARDRLNDNGIRLFSSKNTLYPKTGCWHY